MILITFGTVKNVEAQERSIPVNLIILQESNGQGNEVWAKNNVYAQAVIDGINNAHYKSGAIQLKLGSKKIVKDSRLYHSPMSSGSNTLIKKYDGQGKKGSILVVIAREEKVDVSGRAERQGTDHSPVFIMRTVLHNPDPAKSDYVAGPNSIRVSAGLFVHEMAHMMNLNHQDRSNRAIHTENYTKVAAGKQIWEGYLKKLASYNPLTSTVSPAPPVSPVTPVTPPSRGGIRGGGGGSRIEWKLPNLQ